jgi:hypothetical protein
MEIYKAFSRNVISPTAQTIDKLVRFGNKEEIGATAVSVLVDKRDKKI